MTDDPSSGVWDEYDKKVVSLMPAGAPPRSKGSGPDRDNCPIAVLGHLDGNFWFLDAVGQLRSLTASQLSKRGDLVGLFGGEDGVAWLLEQFPRIVTRKVVTIDGEEYTESVQGFLIAAVSDWLMSEAKTAGLFGAHLRLRKPGVWPDADGRPVVHCGDMVFIDGKPHKPGTRIGNEIWAAAPATAKPSEPCDRSIAETLQGDMRELWKFRKPGGEIIAVGLLGVGYFGATIPWRSNGFLIGPAGSGKTMLLEMMRAASPMHHFTSDTTKPGLEQAVNGRAMAIYVEEAADRQDQRGAQALMDIVLSATGGEGTKGHRGSAGGQVRTIEVVGSIIMAAVSPPAMQPQHEARFTMIEMVRPEAGEDNKLAMQAAIRRARDAGPQLWARAIASMDRYNTSLELFRSALSDAGCAPREMDQAGAILAGWWVLTEDGVPDARQAKGGVLVIAEYVRSAVDVSEDDGSRRMLDHMLSSLVPLERSSDHESIGTLIRRAFLSYDLERDIARKILVRYGIRCVGFNEIHDGRGMEIPRGSEGDGIWFANGYEPLKALFRGSPFEGDRWRFELGRLESARKSAGSVRIGGSKPGRAIWVSRHDVVGDDNEDVTPKT